MRRLRSITMLAVVCLAATACSTATARTRAAERVAPTTTSTSLPPPSTASTTTTSTLPMLQQAAGLHRRLDQPRPLRVMVVGDSVGTTLGTGMQAWAQETGAAVVRDESRAWCSLGRYLPRNVFGPQNSTAGCDDWETRWASDVQDFDPDVVLAMYTVWEVIPRLLPGASVFSRPGNPAHNAWQLSEYQRAADVLSARGARVVFFSIACENNAVIERGEPFWHVNRRTLPRLARSRPAVRLVDLDRLLCGGGKMRNSLGGVPDIRPDHAHFSDAGALALSRWLMPIVLGRVPLPAYALS